MEIIWTYLYYIFTAFKVYFQLNTSIPECTMHWTSYRLGFAFLEEREVDVPIVMTRQFHEEAVVKLCQHYNGGRSVGQREGVCKKRTSVHWIWLQVCLFTSDIAIVPCLGEIAAVNLDPLLAKGPRWIEKARFFHKIPGFEEIGVCKTMQVRLHWLPKMSFHPPTLTLHHKLSVITKFII